MKSRVPGGSCCASLISLGSRAWVTAITMSAPSFLSEGASFLTVAVADLYVRFGGRLLIVSLPVARSERSTIPYESRDTYSHSRSTIPIKPTFKPVEVVSMTVFFAFPSGTSSPRAGSRTYRVTDVSHSSRILSCRNPAKHQCIVRDQHTFARSQGKLHLLAKCWNWGTPKSRSWFSLTVSTSRSTM